jgi:hypothetical protein
MPAGNTYEAIATQTLGSAAASVTFSSIPSTYTDLVLVISAQDTTNNSFSLICNSDTGTNYSRTRLLGDGSVTTSARTTNATSITFNYIGQSGSIFSASIVSLMNYSNSTTYKTILGRSNAATSGTSAAVGLWRSTSAINSIEIGTVSFTAGSTFSLYGIAAA